MNLPNKLTASRFFITLIFVVVMLWDAVPYNTSWAALLFFIGGMTDIADGKIARHCNLQTDFGALMDPLADKILVCAGFILLVGMEIDLKAMNVDEEAFLGNYKLPEAIAAPGAAAAGGGGGAGGHHGAHRLGAAREGCGGRNSVRKWRRGRGWLDGGADCKSTRGARDCHRWQ